MILANEVMPTSSIGQDDSLRGRGAQQEASAPVKFSISPRKSFA